MRYLWMLGAFAGCRLVSPLLLPHCCQHENAFKHRVSNIAGWDEDDRTFATNIAVDWSVTLGVHSAMFSAIVSVLVTCSEPPSFALTVSGVITVATLWYILAQVISEPQIGELVENRRFGPAF